MKQDRAHKALHSGLAPYFSRTRGDIVPGAHRLQQLLSAQANSGILEFKTILVAGTNGKGSVSALLESALDACGFKTGLYTSPHLIHPAERIRVGGISVSEKILADALEEVELSAKNHLPDATFFEISTAAALLVFQRCKIDVLVCEVGLGGHYDSTNALSPSVSVLTSVGLDHMELLGNTVREIAADKAHISRRNVPLVLGSLAPEAYQGVLSTAALTGCEIVDSCKLQSPKWLKIMAMAEQNAGAWLQLNLHNLKTAVCALCEFELHLEHSLNPQSLQVRRLEPERVAQGLAHTFWPGRFDARKVMGVDVIFDGAHNSHGIAYFIDQFKKSQFAARHVMVIYGSLSDKDWKSVLPQLQQLSRDFVFTQPDSPRAVDPLLFLNHLDAACRTHLEKQVADALKVGLERASEQNAVLVLTGSLVLVGECFERLNIDPFGPLVRSAAPKNNLKMQV